MKRPRAAPRLRVDLVRRIKERASQKAASLPFLNPMKKRALTLLEVMISLVLASILLTTLFSFYRELFFTRAKMQKNKEVVFQRMLTQERLSQVFSKVLAEIEEKKGLVFYTTEHASALGPVLYFFYDNGIDPNPSFCGALKAMLYLSTDKNLTLYTWPDRKEVLLENVESLQLSFFDIKKKVWKEEWLGEKEGLPAALKLSLKTKKIDEFIFFLPGSYKQITYTKS
ncbi:MAG: type II secretion system protein GspJ [Chlamydiota bacterium]